MTGDLADDFDADAGGVDDALVILAAISPDQADEGEEAARDLQKRAATITILDIGGMRLDQQGPAVAVDQRMAFAALNLPACIIAARPAGFGGFDALAVDDRGAGSGLAPPR